MLPYLQLFLAGFAIYSALQFQEGTNLYVPLACLVSMLVVSRIDRNKSEEKKARKSFLKAELEKITKNDGIPGRDQDFFTIESLLWPKSELLLIDSVHAIFKELGFKISTGIGYRSVDRIVRIPETEMSFGLEIMLSENEADRTHPKVLRAMQFEKEKKGKEKTLIIASTNSKVPLTERTPVTHISRELADLLTRHGMSIMTTRQLYELWQRAKVGQIDVFDAFAKVYSRPGGPLPPALF